MGIGETVRSLTASMQRRVRLAVRRAIVRYIYDDPKLQEVQLAVMADELRDNVERFQQYGFSSVPLPGAEAIVLAIGGNAGHSVVLAVDDRRYRLSGGAAGEVTIYDDQGQFVRLARENTIEVETAGTIIMRAAEKIRLETPLLEVTGDIKDLCDGTGRSMAGMRSVYNSHTHPENDDGGPTSAPNQVM